MLSPEQVRLTCQNHNKDIVQICKSQKCKIVQKACCLICMNNNAHMGCDLILIEDIPQFVEDHKISYAEIQNSIEQLEEEFKKRTKIMREVLEGYQIEETFICISQLEHLNILAKVFRKLPKLKERMDEISKIIKYILQELSSQKLDQLRKFQQEDLQTTMLQNEQTTRLIQNQRNQNNQGKVETNNLSATNQSTNRNNRVEELLNQGKQCQKSLNYSLAIRYFENVLQIEPKNIEALVNIMNTLFEMNYCHSSIAFQNKILEQNPQNFDAVLQQGVILYNQKKYGQSIDYINEKLNSFSDKNQQKELLKLLSNNYIENNQLQLAINILNQLRSNYGENLFYFQGSGSNNIKYLIAKCCLLKDEITEAQKHLDNANQMVNNDSESAIIQIQIFEKQGQYSKCLNQIDQEMPKSLKIKVKEKLMKLQSMRVLQFQSLSILNQIYFRMLCFIVINSQNITKTILIFNIFLGNVHNFINCIFWLFIFLIKYQSKIKNILKQKKQKTKLNFSSIQINRMKKEQISQFNHSQDLQEIDKTDEGLDQENQ